MIGNVVWVIWVSNEEVSNIIGVSSSKEIALDRIKGLIETPSPYTLRDGTVVVDIDGFSSFFFVPLKIDADLSPFDEESYGLES